MNQLGVYAGVKGSQLILAFASLLLVVVLFWFKGICIIPHRRISKKDSHVVIHLCFGAKGL